MLTTYTEFADAISTIVLLSYVLFYTSYNKVSKRMEVSQLKQFILFEAGWQVTAKELNKILALAGLTLCSSAIIGYNTPHAAAKFFFPLFDRLMSNGSMMVVLHGYFSCTFFFARFNQHGTRLAMVLGVVASSIVTLMLPYSFMTSGALAPYFAQPIAFVKDNYVPCILIFLSAAIAHFILMERGIHSSVERKLVGNFLGCRPYAFLALSVALVALLVATLFNLTKIIGM